MNIRDTLRLWLEPKRWLDDLGWVRKKSFLTFVVLNGMIQFGLMAAGLFGFWLAFTSSSGVISLRDLRIAMLLWLMAGALWAAILWLSAYWHFKNRNGDSSPKDLK